MHAICAVGLQTVLACVAVYVAGCVVGCGAREVDKSPASKVASLGLLECGWRGLDRRLRRQWWCLSIR
jgi:hypothetical protein